MLDLFFDVIKENRWAISTSCNTMTHNFKLPDVGDKSQVIHRTFVPRVVNHVMCKGRQRAVVLSTATWCAVLFCWWCFVKVPGFHHFTVKACYKFITQTLLLAKVPQQKFMLLLAQWSIFIFFEETVRGPVWIARLAILWNETIFPQVFLFKKLKAEFF